MLHVGDKNDKIEIIDADRLCYRVLSRNKGAEGVRTISKDIVSEFIASLRENPNQNAVELREKLTGTSQIDKFEYGYNSTIYALARIYLEKSSEKSELARFCQKIFFGAPGTGKSFRLDDSNGEYCLKKMPRDQVFRTTFHPDYDYAQFVGSYKPVQRKESFNEDILTFEELQGKAKVFTTGTHDLLKFSALYSTSLSSVENKKNVVCGTPLVGDKNDQSVSTQMSNGIAVGTFLKEKMLTMSINYAFVPQVFANAYKAAWEKFRAAGSVSTADNQVYLVIEEINRGNCAQIFGDIFQLLDRDDEGCSRYEIEPDADFAQWLDDQKIEGMPEKLKLPPNFNILATMNTSDQSLFPMDSAFKRRFDWEYVPINYEHEKAKFFIEIGEKNYDWLDFLEKVNEDIYDVTESEDKQMGEFFVKPKEGSKIDMDMFLSKVMFYLWDSVYKDEPDKVNVFHFEWEFEEKKKCKVTFQRLFKDKACTVKILQHIMDENLKVKEFVADKPAE